MPSSFGDYYYRLRLPRNASRREIKAAFRRLARQYHPDLHPNQPGAIEQFRALQEAYEVLIDPVQRQRYDRQIQQGYADVQRHPQSPSDFYIRGIRYTFARRYRAALGDYSQAIELDAQFAEAYLRRAEVQYLLEDDSGVLADCQKAIALNSTEPKTYYYQGMARYRLGYVQSAIAAFTDAITCDPDDAQYYCQRGLSYQDLRELDKAAIDLRRAARLYRNQGDLARYHRLQQYLKPFGTAGRSRFVQFLGAIAGRLSRGHQRPAGQLPTPYRASSPQPIQPFPQSFTRPSTQSSAAERTPARARPLNEIKRPIADRRSLSSSSRWIPGISSRPRLGESPPPRRPSLFSGASAVLKLMSNPAGEMVPLYQQLSRRQVTLVGYGLAVLANLLFVFGTIQYFPESSWLVASWLWASGGMMFVTMVLAVAIARLLQRLPGQWGADIFTLATAMIPLGLLAGVGAFTRSINPWLAYGTGLLAALWALSHALITLYSGLSKIQTFSEETAAWFAPVLLALGLGVGLSTWAWLKGTIAF
jgi:tetratricopeptide (TPR) repeat protein